MIIDLLVNFYVQTSLLKERRSKKFRGLAESYFGPKESYLTFLESLDQYRTEKSGQRNVEGGLLNTQGLLRRQNEKWERKLQRDEPHNNIMTDRG